MGPMMPPGALPGMIHCATTPIITSDTILTRRRLHVLLQGAASPAALPRRWGGDTWGPGRRVMASDTPGPPRLGQRSALLPGSVHCGDTSDMPFPQPAALVRFPPDRLGSLVARALEPGQGRAQREDACCTARVWVCITRHAALRRALRRIAPCASPCRWWTAGLRLLTEAHHGLSCPLHEANRMPLSAAPSLPTALHHALSQGERSCHGSPIVRAPCLRMRGSGACQASAPGCVRRSRLWTLLPAALVGCASGCWHGSCSRGDRGALAAVTTGIRRTTRRNTQAGRGHDRADAPRGAEAGHGILRTRQCGAAPPFLGSPS
jgi:hypothetical protein